jgi:hypothetical protein
MQESITTQAIDLTVIVNAAGQAVVGGRATLNGADVTAGLASCALPGALISGGATFHCPGLHGSTLGPGTHTLSITFNLSGGASVTDTVSWQILAATGP